jgi:hypothetical protein
MKRILIIFLLLSSIGFSQPLINQYSTIDYQSIARTNVGKITFKPKSDYVCRLEYDKFQLSISSKIKRVPFQDSFSDLTVDDIIFAGSYDIRARFYISPNVKVFQRAFITGLSTSQIFHTTGIIIKF